MSLIEIKCPVCGESMVEEFDICDICGWENDPNQLNHPDTCRGANAMTLTEARLAYRNGVKAK